MDPTKVAYKNFIKKFYIEIRNLNSKEVNDMRVEIDVNVRGTNCPCPIQSWTQAGLPSIVMNLLKQRGYEKPTPIQMQAIPAIMDGRDLIGVSKTGSGKTAAFLLPMLRRIC